MGYSDHKSWYQVREATIRVSADFKGIDRADLELGEVVIYPGDFLIGAVTNYDFTPYNTTVRVEDGQIVEMTRRYIPLIANKPSSRICLLLGFCVTPL